MPWGRIGLGLLVAVITLLAVLPLGAVLAHAWSIGGAEAQRLLVRPRVARLVVNTLSLVLAGTAVSAVIGVAVAWAVERSDLPGRQVWAVLAALPIAVPAFVASYSWVSLTPAVEGFGGAVLILSLAYYPLVYLPVAALLRGMDPALEEVGRSLGLGPWRTFFRVVLPQTRPALLGGSLLVALHLLGEFGAFAMLRFDTFTTAIYDQYRLTFNGPAASLLAAALTLPCLALLVAETRVRGDAAAGRGEDARPCLRHQLGWTAPLAVALLAALIGLALGVPLATLGYWLTHGSSAAFPLDTLVTAAGTTLRLGLEAAALTTLLAIPIGFLAVRFPGPLATLCERAVYVSAGLPGIVIALALVTVVIGRAQPLYQTEGLLVTAYAILFLPRALVAVRAAIAQTSRSLEETARTLGARPAQVLWRVTLPLMVPGLGAAAALVFLSVVTELTATLLLAPIGTETLATHVWSNTATLAYGAAAPFAALMVAIGAVPTYLLARRAGALAGIGVT
jgi:iron(III) transport system permease protein